jgi:MarR family 2-MHQ and catechol resistance regulon transcriptional repressor
MSSRDIREELYALWAAREAQRFPEADPLTVSLLLSFHFTYQLVEGYMNRVVQEQKEQLSLSACNVLSILYHQVGHCATFHEIGRLLITSKANITGLTDGLADKGYLERVTHPTDRRIKLARLLPAGREYVERWIPLKHKSMQKALQGLTQEDKQTLNDLLGRIRGSMQACE